MQSYPRLSIEEFGKILIESGDLDPTYIALYTMLSADVLDRNALCRWVLGYSCLYHCGVASYLSEFEGDQFFSELMKAAKNEEPSPLGERWPRSKERRHWRGQQAIASCEALRKRYGNKPEDFFEYIIHGGAPSMKPEAVPFKEVSERVRSNLGYGSWIAFKLADIVDRLGLREVIFKFDDVIIYDSPLKAAEMLVRQRLSLPKEARVKPQAVRDVFIYLEDHFKDYMAPPIYDRPIGVAEVETVLCCWASSMSGHYPPYNDIREVREGLHPWAQISEVASFFLASMPKLPAESIGSGAQPITATI